MGQPKSNRNLNLHKYSSKAISSAADVVYSKVTDESKTTRKQTVAVSNQLGL